MLTVPSSCDFIILFGDYHPVFEFSAVVKKVSWQLSVTLRVMQYNNDKMELDNLTDLRIPVTSRLPGV